MKLIPFVSKTTLKFFAYRGIQGSTSGLGQLVAQRIQNILKLAKFEKIINSSVENIPSRIRYDEIGRVTIFNKN